MIDQKSNRTGVPNEVGGEVFGCLQMAVKETCSS